MAEENKSKEKDDCEPSAPVNCYATIWIKDTYRYCGGKQHFKMHYNEQRCSRKATHGEWCWQHKSGNFLRYRFV